MNYALNTHTVLRWGIFTKTFTWNFKKILLGQKYISLKNKYVYSNNFLINI